MLSFLLTTMDLQESLICSDQGNQKALLSGELFDFALNRKRFLRSSSLKILRPDSSAPQAMNLELVPLLYGTICKAFAGPVHQDAFLCICLTDF